MVVKWAWNPRDGMNMLVRTTKCVPSGHGGKTPRDAGNTARYRPKGSTGGGASGYSRCRGLKSY